MNKIKLFLFAMAIIVIASTSFIGIAMAAQVAWINESKGRVHINGGVNNGFIPGATVCFFVSSASYGDEFVCGSVVSAEASKAVVKVQKSRAKKMKKGTEAMLLVKKEAKEEVEDIDMVALFDSDSAEIKSEAYPMLDEASDILKKNPELNVEIDGHTDNIGPADYNMKISERRANAVMEYFISKGVDAKRLTIKGFGLTKPAANNDTEEGRAKNRRVELTPVK